MNGICSLNYGTQLLVPERSPYSWHQATDCPNRGIPSTLPNTVSSSSTHSCTHPTLAPLCIVLPLPQGHVGVGYSLVRRTLFLYKGLGGQCETQRVSSFFLGASADNLWAIRLSEWGMVCGILAPTSLWDDMS